MPDITRTPVQIDPSTEQSGLATTGCVSEGWYKVGSNFYIVLLTQNGPPFNLNIFKSTDGGTTWVKKGSISVPIAFPVVWCQFDGAHTIWISYAITNTADPNTVSFSTFNTNTDSVSLNTLPNLTDCAIADGQPGVPFIITAGGSIIAVYSQNSNANVISRVGSAGSWGSANALLNAASTTYFVQDIIVDPNVTGGAVGYFVFEQNVSGTKTWNLFGFHVSGTLAFNSNIINNFTNDDLFGHGFVTVIGGVTVVVMPLTRTGSLSNNIAAFVLYGNWFSTGFTLTQLDPGTSANRSIISVGACVDSASGNPTVLWEYQNASILVARKSVLSAGSWSPFSTYYDAIANPPNAVPSVSQSISEICPIPGSVNAVASMSSLTAGFAAFALLSGAAPGPPAIIAGAGLPPLNPLALRTVILPDPKAAHLCRYQGPVPCKCRGVDRLMQVGKTFSV